MTTLNKACISTQIYDLNGWVYLTGVKLNNSNTRSRQRRVNRNKTLDGGVYLDDLGYAHGDRTVTLAVDVDETTENKLTNIIENHALVWLSLTEGAFTAAIQSMSIRANSLSMSILLKASA